LILSAILHVSIVIFAIFGLPQLMPPPTDLEEPIPVELATLADVTTPPPPQVEAPKPEEKPAEPPKPEPPKPAPPPPPPPPPPEPDVVPLPVPKPKPPEPPKPEVKPPDVLQKITPKKKPTDDFDALLLPSVAKIKAAEKPAQDKAAAADRTVKSLIGDLASQPTTSEKDYVAAQIWPRWNVDLGAKGADTLQVTVHIVVQPDGTVTSARLDVDRGRYEGDSFFRAAADAALRAVMSASPLKVPPSRPDLFRNNSEMTINFDPRKMR
jgi:outer membrane biosynthesis protein TonB